MAPLSSATLAPSTVRGDHALRHAGRGEVRALGPAVRVEVVRRAPAESPEAGAAARSGRDAVIDVQARYLEPPQLALQAPAQAPPASRLTGAPAREALARRALGAYQRVAEDRPAGAGRSVRV